MASSTTSDLDVALKDYLSETRGVVSILKNVLIRTVQVVPMVSTVNVLIRTVQVVPMVSTVNVLIRTVQVVPMVSTVKGFHLYIIMPILQECQAR